LLFYFAGTLFVSASLLFLVQPMVGKMILPQLGGTPAVWNTCMVFFQAVLLVGYTYTHSLTTWCSRRTQLLVQLAILVMPFAFFVLPFSMGSWQPPGDANPILSVLWLLLGMVGLPFFVVATSAPLLQKWFADTGHAASKDPYFLYGASNLGSMLALVLYPLAVEPLFDVDRQTELWTIGYSLLAVLVAGCVALVWREPTSQPLSKIPPPSPPDAPVPAPAPAEKTAVQPARRHGRRGAVWKAQQPEAKAVGQPVSSAGQAGGSGPLHLGRRLRWLALAAVPSSLMLGVTTYLTTDVAAIPFFWVIPLALYLLTFILVFARWPIVWTGTPHQVALYIQPFLLTVVVMYFVQGTFFKWVWLLFSMHVALFFITALVCHGELAKDRPGTAHLTEFYLWMSLGGVLGGAFNAFVAPFIFWTGALEYPLAMICAYFLRPKMIGKYLLIPGDTNAYETTRLGWLLDLSIWVLIGIWTFLVFITSEKFEYFSRERTLALGSLIFEVSLADLCRILAGVLIMGMYARPLRFGLSLASLAIFTMVYQDAEGRYVFVDRDFFGFVRVQVKALKVTLPDGSQDYDEYRALIHGDIDHGWQALAKERRRDAITYFHPLGGIGQVFERFNWYGVDRQSLVPKDAAINPEHFDKLFAWPDYRLPVSLLTLGASPLDPGWAMLAVTQSEPAFGCIGLGIGTIAAHAKPFQFVRFYEIQPAVKRLSLPGNGKEPWFYFLQDALDRGADVKVVLGDGRLTLAKDKVEKYYHIFVIDAFSSDAIPPHLLTKEALQMYLSKLADGGVLVFNVTNRYMDLKGPLRALADDLDLSCWHYGDYNQAKIRRNGEEVDNPDYVPLMSGSDWVVIQRRVLDVNHPSFNGGLIPMPERVLPAPFKSHTWEQPEKLDGPIWTDSYYNLLRVMSWR
jgi:hypothetical protein